jgi:hypothetical protein
MTRRRPVWFRNHIAQRGYMSPVTWQGYLIAAAMVGGIIGSLALAVHLAPVYPVVAMVLPVGGIVASISAYFVALSLYGEP